MPDEFLKLTGFWTQMVLYN